MSQADQVEPEPIPCSLCGSPLRDDEITTCFGCIAKARTCLVEIGELYEQLPDAIATLVAITYDGGGGGHARDDTPVVGGDALVMLAGGTAGAVVGARDGNRKHAADQHLSDPPSAAAVLGAIEDDWRHYRRDVAAPYEPAVSTSLRYLLEHLRWAAEQHPAFEVHLDDLRSLRSRMEVVTHNDARPVPVGAPCMRCGGRVVHRWREDGLDTENRECERCGRSWSQVAAYRLAQRAAIEDLPATSPDALVTVVDAKRIFRGRVPANTLDQWAKREVVPKRGRDARGRSVFRLGDLAERVEDRERVEARARALFVKANPKGEWDELTVLERARWRGRARSATDDTPPTEAGVGAAVEAVSS